MYKSSVFAGLALAAVVAASGPLANAASPGSPPAGALGGRFNLFEPALVPGEVKTVTVAQGFCDGYVVLLKTGTDTSCSNWSDVIVFHNGSALPSGNCAAGTNTSITFISNPDDVPAGSGTFNCAPGAALFDSTQLSYSQVPANLATLTAANVTAASANTTFFQGEEPVLRWSDNTAIPGTSGLNYAADTNSFKMFSDKFLPGAPLAAGSSIFDIGPNGLGLALPAAGPNLRPGQIEQRVNTKDIPATGAAVNGVCEGYVALPKQGVAVNLNDSTTWSAVIVFHSGNPPVSPPAKLSGDCGPSVRKMTLVAPPRGGSFPASGELAPAANAVYASMPSNLVGMTVQEIKDFGTFSQVGVTTSSGLYQMDYAPPGVPGATIRFIDAPAPLPALPIWAFLLLGSGLAGIGFVFVSRRRFAMTVASL